VTLSGSGRCRSSALSAEGTVLTSVTAGSPSRSASSSRSRTSTTRPPSASVTSSSNTDRSKDSEVEARTPSRSLSENVSLAQRASAATEPCSISTPFGRPVDPEV
jgi:hypothetical protein